MNDSTNATVSVVLATYRRDSVLQRALNSLAIQTYDNFEIVLVDDNDSSLWNLKVEKVVNEFRKSYPKIRLVYIQNHPNMGSARTRNVGIEKSTGEYICFLDDDDVYLSDRIRNQVLPLSLKGADYSVTNLALYSENEKLIEVRKREYIKDSTKESLMKYHLLYHITGTDTMMFRKDYLLSIGGFSGIDVGDEFYLMQKAIEAGGRFLHVPVCDVKAYVHMGENGLSSGQKKIEGEIYLYNQKKRYFDVLDKKSVKYIKMRHHAVLAYAYLRTKKFGMFFVECFMAFLCAPLAFLSMILNRDQR